MGSGRLSRDLRFFIGGLDFSNILVINIICIPKYFLKSYLLWTGKKSTDKKRRLLVLFKVNEAFFYQRRRRLEKGNKRKLKSVFVSVSAFIDANTLVGAFLTAFVSVFVNRFVKFLLIK